MLINPSLVCFTFNRFTNGTVARRRFYVVRPIKALRKQRNNILFANNFNINKIKATKKYSQRILYLHRHVVFIPRKHILKRLLFFELKLLKLKVDLLY